MSDANKLKTGLKSVINLYGTYCEFLTQEKKIYIYQQKYMKWPFNLTLTLNELDV